MTPKALATALALTLPASCALAQEQVITGSAAADAMIRDALAEQRLFLTCSALDPATHATVTAMWLDMAREAEAILRDAGQPASVIDGFSRAAKPFALMPAPGTHFGEVLALCNSRPDWPVDLARLDIVMLNLHLDDALAQ